MLWAKQITRLLYRRLRKPTFIALTAAPLAVLLAITTVILHHWGVPERIEVKNGNIFVVLHAGKPPVYHPRGNWLRVRSDHVGFGPLGSVVRACTCGKRVVLLLPTRPKSPLYLRVPQEPTRFYIELPISGLFQQTAFWLHGVVFFLTFLVLFSRYKDAAVAARESAGDAIDELDKLGRESNTRAGDIWKARVKIVVLPVLNWCGAVLDLESVPGVRRIFGRRPNL